MLPARSLSALASIVLLLGALAHDASAQSKESTKTTGAVSGRVTLEGKPVGGVEVYATDAKDWSPNGQKIIARTTTDANGNYRLERLPTGVMALTADRPGYVTVEGETSAVRSVTLAEGERVEGIDLDLVEGGAITGRVTDENGRPIIAEWIQIERADAASTRVSARATAYISIGRNTTDDRGIYRIWGLMPGRYYVSAGRDADNGGYFRGGVAYRRAFYPGTASQSEATAVTVTSGGEVSNVDLVLHRAEEGFSIAGRAVVTGTSKPVPNARVFIGTIGANKMQSMSSAVVTNSSGSFKITGLKPGDYGLFIGDVALNAERDDESLYSEVVRVSVVDSDVESVVLAADRAASITGRVELDPGGVKDVALESFRVSSGIRPTEDSTKLVVPYGSSAEVAADGSFRLQGVRPGLVSLGVYSRADYASVMVLSIEREGTPIADGVEVSPGARITGVIIRAAVGTGSIRGAVTIENAPPGRQYPSVMIQRADLPNWQSYANVDEQNQFLFDHLPAGTYSLQLNVSVNVNGAEWKSYRTAPKEITVGSSRVDATIDIVVGPETEVER